MSSGVTTLGHNYESMHSIFKYNMSYLFLTVSLNWEVGNHSVHGNYGLVAKYFGTAIQWNRVFAKNRVKNTAGEFVKNKLRK